MKNIILLETSVTGSGTAIFESAKKMGVNLIFLYQDFKKYEHTDIDGYLNQGLTHFQLNTQSLEDLKNFLIDYQQNHSLDGIICLNDRCIENASKLAEFFNLPFMNSKAVSICRNKDRTANMCENFGIRTPKTHSISMIDELEKLIPELVYPIVLKPSRGYGSMDVVFCQTREELDEFLPKILDHALQIRGTLLIQEYILGPLISVEAITFKGKTTILGVTDRIMGPLPYFVEMGSSFPVNLGTQKEHELFGVVHHLIESLEIQFGITHIEFILSKDGPVLIEINPRLSGGLAGRMISLAYRFDLFNDIIRLALGSEPQMPALHQQAVSECFLYPIREGKIKKISGIKLAKESPGVEEVFPIAHEGDWGELAKNYASTPLLGILTTGETIDISTANCRAALSQIRVE